MPIRTIKVNNISSISHTRCYGCSACMAICPREAISMEFNNEGFVFPSVNSNCVNCGKCLKVCSAFKDLELEHPISKIVVQYKDTDALRRSSSGGLFYGLAKHIINTGGFVTGCVMQEDYSAKHIITNNVSDLIKMQGSKYIQSRLSKELFLSIKEKLESNKNVLFSGTPCQASALLLFLNKNYDNLIVLDLICHGVASPGLFKNYISNYPLKVGEIIKDIGFRSKKYGEYPNNYSLTLTSNIREINTIGHKDRFLMAFSHNRILRESCYNCGFSKADRVSDITVGDFDCFDKLDNTFVSRDGLSVVLINTAKGKKVFESIKNFYNYQELNFNYSQINLIQPSLRPKDRDKMKKMKYDDNNPKSKIGIKLRIKLSDSLKRIIPKKLKYKIKLLMNKKRGAY